MNNQAEKSENVFLGFIGALAGALIGVLAIVLLGQIGLVASIAGAALAICSLKGYEMLAGKLSRNGIITCSIIMVIMTFFAEYLDWTIQFFKELQDYYSDISIMDIFKNLPYLLSETGSVGRFILSLCVLYIFTALGAVPRIRRVLAIGNENTEAAIKTRSLRERAKVVKWDPLVCRPQDIIDLCEECISIDAPELKLFFDYNGETHTVGISSYLSNPVASPTNIRYYLDADEFMTIEDFKKSATINGTHFMDLEYVTVTEDELTGDPHYVRLLKAREIKKD